MSAFDFDALAFKMDVAVSVLSHLGISDGGVTLRKVSVIAREYGKAWADERERNRDKK